jgi:hypothetical protein
MGRVLRPIFGTHAKADLRVVELFPWVGAIMLMISSGRRPSAIKFWVFICVYGEELFVVAFVELFVVGRQVSGLADDKAVSSCLDDFDRDNLGCSLGQKVA